MTIPTYMQVAIAELTDHVSESPGVANNARIIQYHAATLLKAHVDSCPWCSSFVCFCFETAGISSTRNAMARSWLTWDQGKVIDSPEFGDVVILARGDPGSNQGHVGFYLLSHGGKIALLSGNMNDRVDVNWFATDRVLGVRRWRGAA